MTGVRPASGDLPDGLAALAAAHGEEIGALAALVLQHRAAAETVAARSLVRAYRDPSLPLAGPARRIHLLRSAFRRTLEMERRSRTVEPHPTGASAELLARAVPGATTTPDEQRIAAPALLAAMASLPARLRALVVLHDLLGLEARELAAVTGGSPSRVQRQLAAAEDRLRTSLEAAGETGTIEEIGDAV